jgi:hypothetical protein
MNMAASELYKDDLAFSALVLYTAAIHLNIINIFIFINYILLLLVL